MAASKLFFMLDQTWSTFSVVLKAFLCLQQNSELVRKIQVGTTYFLCPSVNEIYRTYSPS